ncbi:hypothetical protein KDW_47150 [Dictyobacter vulcani]|uniref:MmeI-like target recognition domain-containing protein n=1 Tax=Dictyobacter vulcani TaxID=2607529 RepID=A0A5J4KSA7_9CHLR|nr:type IIL restriction-modification enzyme MmeI [Dictyobacter vulcani]GER90553.1 hypothetical protein KDW_47150 [Dictyobacter vulcani]
MWVRKGDWNGIYWLNGKIVKHISPQLTASNSKYTKPKSLYANMKKSFKGHNIYGKGFVLETKEAEIILKMDSRYKEVTKPFLNGEDLNTHFEQNPSRWIINFQNWSLEKAQTYPICIQIVREKVKPERDHNKRLNRREQWWIYGDYAKGLENAISDMKQVLVVAQTSKYHNFVFVPNTMVYDQKVIVFALNSFTDFIQLQTSLHTEWVLANSSTLGLTPVYAPSDCFETYPFPHNTTNLELKGKSYYNHRQSIMQTRQEGLTKTYNRFHNPKEQSPDIIKLRELHKEMDEAVAQAYGWDDLALEHGFHETKQGLRYTISEAARQEVLDRLLLLNHQRHAEEVAAGLVDENGKPTAKGKKLLAKDADNQHGRAKKNQAGKDGGNGQHPGSAAGTTDDEPGQATLFDL